MTLSGPGITRRQAIAGAAAAAALLPFAATAQEATYVSGDMVKGSPDAAIEIIEYASLGCPACKRFHETVWPSLKTDWVDTGKVRFIFREFPLDQAALAAAMLARCGGEERYFAFIDVLFSQQSRWHQSPDPMRELRNIAALGGVDGGRFDACMTNETLQNEVLQARLDGHQQYKVDATPFILVNGERFKAWSDYDALNDHLESLG